MLLHWSPKSPFVRKVMIAAHELALVEQLDLRRTVVRMDNPNLALLKDNPLGKIPTLMLDDGEVIIDSGVICEYFDTLAGGGRLLPVLGPAHWRERSRHAMLNGLMELLILWRNERDKPPEKQTEAWLKAFELKTLTALTRFEGDQPPIGGDLLQLSEITLGCCLSYLDFRFADLAWRNHYPTLARWHAVFSARPSALATEIVADG